jgi:two-component system phosphate regulon sensor histidine kinase PhoR
MTGVQVLEALRDEGCDIPVILMTLHGSEDLAVQVFRLGVRDYVAKPFEIGELLAAIDRALTELRLRRERDALTRQLEAEHRKLEAVLANTEDAVILVEESDADRVSLVNRSARRAFDMDGHVVGHPLAEVVDDEVLVDVFRRARAGGQSARAEVSLPDERTLNAQVTPIPGVGRVAVMQDITHLKELDRMKSEFVTNVSHDLRSPLTSVKGFADLLPMAGPLNEQQEDFLARIQRGIDNVTQMITDLLDLGRIEAEVNLEMEPCDLGGIVEQAMNGHLNHAALKKQSLNPQVAPDLPPVWGNPLRLGQVVSNLVGNAVKYTPEGGQITVSVTQEDGHVAVAVADDGIGIPAADLPHIFDKFYRVKNAQTDGIVGTGLGLSLVRSIVEKHQGRIWVRSQAGQGSTFTFVLPTVTQE